MKRIGYAVSTQKSLHCRLPAALSCLAVLIEPGPDGDLVVRGEVDHTNCTFLAASLELAGRGQSDVRLDLRDLEFIDVAGVRAIHSAAAGLEAGGRRLTLVSPRGAVRRVIDLTEFGLMIEDAA